MCVCEITDIAQFLFHSSYMHICVVVIRRVERLQKITQYLSFFGMNTYYQSFSFNLLINTERVKGNICLIFAVPPLSSFSVLEDG